MNNDAKQIICLANPKFKKLFKRDKNMELKFKKNICGFDFVKIGEAYLCDEPLKAKFDGKELENYKLALKLINNDLLKAEQSTYLVYVEDKLMYVGYYSGSFKTRWLREQNNNLYFWHSDNIDNQVNKLIKDNKSVSVWLSVNPYAKTKDNELVNISKVLEDKIIMEKQPKWNTVGKDLAINKKNTKTVMEILNINE